MVDVAFENKFWLQILGDHMRFLLIALPSLEQSLLEQADDFKDLADTLLDQARSNIDVSATAYQLAYEIYAFKRTLLIGLTQGQVVSNLPPTFISHMMNENREYLRILNNVITPDQVSSQASELLSQSFQVDLTAATQELGQLNIHSLDIHQLWLPDAIGHLDSVYCTLDAVECLTRKRVKKLKKEFMQLNMKCQEYIYYVKHGDIQFNGLNQLDNEVLAKLNEMVPLLSEIQNGRRDKKLQGTIIVLMLDHMIREEAYYIMKVLQNAGQAAELLVDPTAPRVTDLNI